MITEQFRIQVLLEAFSKGFKPMVDSARKSISALQNNVSGFSRVMKEQLPVFKDSVAGYATSTNAGERLATGVRELTHGMKGFRMEALGVMFFGMMLQRTFMGLLQPVMEAYGIFEIFSDMLTILFLPIMDALFEPLLNFMLFFMNLPAEVQMVIGVLVVLGLALGTLLMISGQLVLGLGSLILFWPIFQGVMAAVVGFITGSVIVVFAILIAIIVGMGIAWKENFANMKQWTQVFWNSIKGIFESVFDVILGIVDLFIAIFKGDLDGIWAAVKRIFSGIVGYIWNAFKLILSFFTMLGIGVFRLIFGIWSIVFKVFSKMWNWLKDTWFGQLAIKIWTWARNVFSRMAAGIRSMASAVKNAILGLFPSWARDMIWSGGKFVVSIFKRGGDDDEGAKKGSPGGSFGDFIWRPGSKPIGFNKDDTLVGFKGGAPLGIGGSIAMNPTYNIQVIDRYELEKVLNDHDRRMVDEVRRLIKQ